ncbi:hypothetical protein L0U85_03850 [Glycomyces sp. L485]|uniref:hypothetical protein n=1 Tax=Glycomyces sp. L485 TaxID=2909235 RepID=UPI001F4B16D6|nr:hypothetical protein [Glycomyces sp. L485]MCH7229996.1 hypothetical protein [Glycomyces sp. L485]
MIRKPLATGIVHVPPGEKASSRLGLVGVVGETGLEVMRAVPRWDRTVLVAVLKAPRRIARDHWFGPGRTVYTRTVETPVALGTGAVCIATTDPSGICDLIGIRPADEIDMPWLDPVALARVEGRYARLELHRPPETRGQSKPRDRSV